MAHVSMEFSPMPRKVLLFNDDNALGSLFILANESDISFTEMTCCHEISKTEWFS